MMRMVQMFLLCLMLQSGWSLGVEGSAESLVLGQVVGAQARLDGAAVPAGTTVLAGSQVSAGKYPAAVHLTTGQIVEISSNSSAAFERAATGEISVLVESGAVRFRSADGNISSVGPSDRLSFSQRRAGQPILENEEGVVGVLIARAERGQRELRVRDASRIEPTGELVIRTREGHIKEVKCGIESIRNNVVIITNDLEFTFEPEDLLVQRLPVKQHDVYSKLTADADDGDDLLKVDDATRVNPLERILIKHPTQPIREVACVRYTESFPTNQMMFTTVIDSSSGRVTSSNSRIKLVNDLRNEFPVNSEVRQGVQIGTQEVVTELSLRAESGQRHLSVRNPESIDPLQQVMIRSTDGQRFEAYCVYAVERDRVVLAEDLDFDYEVGSQIVQGRSAAELIASGVALQRTANCCCCCDGGFAALPFAWWWLIPPAVIPPAVLIPPEEPITEIQIPTDTLPPTPPSN